MSLHPPTAPYQPDAANPRPGHENGHGGLAQAEAAAGTSPITAKLKALDDPLEGGLPAAAPRRGVRWVLVLAGVAALGVVAFGVYHSVGAFEDPYKGLEFQKIERGKVILTIVEKGELEASKNTDIICRVRAKSPNNSIASSIKWLVDDGTKVSKGDIVIRLDDSGLKEQYKNQEIVVTEKRSLLVQAEKDKEIVESQNRSNLETAAINIKMAEIKLEQLLKGDLEQKRKALEGQIKLAESDLLIWKDKSSWSQKMVEKGYVSTSQAQGDEGKLRGAEFKLDELKEQNRVLNYYQAVHDELDLRSKLAQARTALKVAQIEADGKEAQAAAKLQAALSVLSQEETKLAELGEDVRNCTIAAPNDGMVVYYIPESSRFGGGGSSQQMMIAQGESVREGQRLMRIPELKHMQVKVKIHEAIVARLRGDVMEKTGFGESIYAALAACPPDLARLVSIQAGAELVAPFADQEERLVELGLPAKVKIPSLEKPLDGHVRSVSAVASSTDWMSSDVKVYPTIVYIDEQVEGLKPGMSAEVTIHVDELDNVLRLPVQAVLEAGGKRFCYVKNPAAPDGLDKRELITGLNNNKFVEVKEGSQVAEGDEVVLNPRATADRRGDLQSVYSDPGEGMGRRAGPRRPRNGDAADKNGGSANGRPERRQGGGGGPGSMRPGGGPGGMGPGAGGPGGMNMEEMQKRQQEFMAKFKAATPKQRKEMLEQIPEAFRERAKEGLKAQGLEIAD